MGAHGVARRLQVHNAAGMLLAACMHPGHLQQQVRAVAR